MPSYRRSFSLTLSTISSLVGSEEIFEMNDPPGPSEDISPDSEPRNVTLLTEEGPLEVCIVKSKAIPEPNGKFRCPVPHCNFGPHTRLRITKHFRDDHPNYRSWRDVFLRKDAPHFIVKDDKKESTRVEEAVSSSTCESPQAGESPLDSLQRLVDHEEEPSEAPSAQPEALPNPPSIIYQPLQPMMAPPGGVLLPPQVQPPEPQYRVIQVLVPSRLLQAGPSISPAPGRPFTLLPVQRVGSTLVPQLNEPRILLSSPHQSVPIVAPNPGFVPPGFIPPTYPLYNPVQPSPQLPPQPPPQ